MGPLGQFCWRGTHVSFVPGKTVFKAGNLNTSNIWSTRCLTFWLGLDSGPGVNRALALTRGGSSRAVPLARHVKAERTPVCGRACYKLLDAPVLILDVMMRAVPLARRVKAERKDRLMEEQKRAVPCTPQHTPYTLHPTPNTLHPTPYTQHPAPYMLHPTPYNLHPSPHALHPSPYSLDPQPYTLNPKP